MDFQIKVTQAAANRLGRRTPMADVREWLSTIKDQLADGQVHEFTFNKKSFSVWLCGETIIVQ